MNTTLAIVPVKTTEAEKAAGCLRMALWWSNTSEGRELSGRLGIWPQKTLVAFWRSNRRGTR